MHSFSREMEATKMSPRVVSLVIDVVLRTNN